jgi:hypothetical protein
VHLGNISPFLGPHGFAALAEPQAIQPAVGKAKAPILGGDPGQVFYVTPFSYPLVSNWINPATHIN